MSQEIETNETMDLGQIYRECDDVAAVHHFLDAVLGDDGSTQDDLALDFSRLLKKSLKSPTIL